MISSVPLSAIEDAWHELYDTTEERAVELMDAFAKEQPELAHYLSEAESETSKLDDRGFLMLYVTILLALGMILDSSSILLIMTPIAVPIAADLGFNLIQFGIITVIAVEVGLLTPPFGISVFTVKSTLNDPNVSVESIFAGSLPYVAVMLLVLVLIPGVGREVNGARPGAPAAWV